MGVQDHLATVNLTTDVLIDEKDGERFEATNTDGAFRLKSLDRVGLHFLEASTRAEFTVLVAEKIKQGRLKPVKWMGVKDPKRVQDMHKRLTVIF